MAETVFSLRNITKIFPNGNRALNGVNLDIAAGECLIIAGSNGSGKTLLMRILAGLSDPTEGEILFKNRPAGQHTRELRSFLGFVFQDADAQMLGETVAEDAAFGPKNLGLSAAGQRAEDSLKAMGLEDKKAYSPRRLSGGEKRRLAVAGVLAMGCETVIMDEPFANLDWPGVVQVLEAIRSLKEAGKTVIILTHELEKVLAMADRLVILDKGHIRGSGRPEEVLDRLKPEYGIRDPRKSYAAAGDCTWLDR
ncbi:energy-coupling factor ABC transporter ATP-binding protein [Breznakiella homolactica]|uniref:ABC transporter ATP-binding protein n=1 Tax=Breznakiella homolactica TaxID=2798577 RepID=A0A7T7XKF4_9SPIR|nr:ABC transporter ATP-binding protein [Breznakiella homolactica]QQO07991.1 energy-coupling factor ABC transporter ATP-binding protein [Breznakiella homolactica]